MYVYMHIYIYIYMYIYTRRYMSMANPFDHRFSRFCDFASFSHVFRVGLKCAIGVMIYIYNLNPNTTIESKTELHMN